MRSYVLDANALLIFLSNRPGALRIGKILKDASREGSPAVMSAVNWGEVIYSLWKMRGEAETNAAIANTEMLPLAIVPADRRKATRAAELKARHRLGYADCFAAGLAIELGATLITADPEFKKVGNKLKVEFLPRHESAFRNQI
jgi:predicted nucleic acid-binding protein